MHFLSSAEGKAFLEREYVFQCRTTRDIATQLTIMNIPTYHTLVQRALKKHGIPIRDKSAAQAEALKSERAKHPTKGTHRPESIKRQISNKLRKQTDNVSTD